MIEAFRRAVAQLAAPEFRRILKLSIALAVGSFAALFAAIAAALPWLAARLPAGAPDWVTIPIALVTGVGALVLALVLFPGLVTAIQAGVLQDRICAAVEQRYYPGLPEPRAPGIGAQLAAMLGQLGAVIGLNLLALPVYLVPGANVAVFAALNGYLLARETFAAVAPRRLAPAEAARIWRAGRARFWGAGALLALLMAVPLLNLVGALLAAAVMTHLVEAARRAPSALP
jgi:CysZ protein